MKRPGLMKKVLNRVALVLAIFSLIVLGGSFIVPGIIKSRAKLIQVAKENDPDLKALTGEAWTAVGAPQKIIVDDPKAFLPGKGDDGADVVSDDYLRAHGEYPLQAKTVDFFAGLLSQVSGAALLLCLVFFILTRVKKDQSSNP